MGMAESSLTLDALSTTKILYNKDEEYGGMQEFKILFILAFSGREDKRKPQETSAMKTACVRFNTSTLKFLNRNQHIGLFRAG